MKLSLILAALGAIPFAAADVAANGGPFDDEYNKYCGDGKTDGTITAGDKVYNYHCNSKQNQEDGWQRFRVDTVEKCADLCSQNLERCDGSVWDKEKGSCWIGKLNGKRSEKPGRIVLSFDENGGKLASCKADLNELKQWGPHDPVCEYPQS